MKEKLISILKECDELEKKRKSLSLDESSAMHLQANVMRMVIAKLDPNLVEEYYFGKK